MPPRRYTSPEEDSSRWDGFRLRAGDIVVSTRSKHGTTWMQTILLQMIHRSPRLPAPLAQLSPWLDHVVEPLDVVSARLSAQQHRRVIKTHTPLDGLPLDPRVHYVVVARHPLDAAVSLYHQGGNIDRGRLGRLTGAPVPAGPAQRPPVGEWLRGWIDARPDPCDQLDSLPGVMRHLSDAWARRHQGNVVLVHFGDLLADIDRQMRRLAEVLGIDVAGCRWNDLVEAGGFDRMRGRAEQLVPDPAGVLRRPEAFFRRGSAGEGPGLLDADALGRYRRRVAALAPADLIAWLHRPRSTPESA